MAEAKKRAAAKKSSAKKAAATKTAAKKSVVKKAPAKRAAAKKGVSGYGGGSVKVVMSVENWRGVSWMSASSVRSCNVVLVVDSGVKGAICDGDGAICGEFMMKVCRDSVFADGRFWYRIFSNIITTAKITATSVMMIKPNLVSSSFEYSFNMLASSSFVGPSLPFIIVRLSMPVDSPFLLTTLLSPTIGLSPVFCRFSALDQPHISGLACDC